MKKLFIITSFAMIAFFTACSDVQREPGRTYMPDMAYSRAYETYAERDSDNFTMNRNAAGDKIFYNNMPVSGTIARGEEMPFLIPKDAQGDTTNYIASKQISNPILALNENDMKEAERLYLINCGICHGKNLDGNGPLYKDGNGPFPAHPAALKGDAKYVNMPEGQMFYSVTYGKNLMGSYASQLSRKQRWMVIAYIKAQQGEGKPSMSTASTDSTSNKTKQ